jgi:hypothetical protein
MQSVDGNRSANEPSPESDNSDFKMTYLEKHTSFFMHHIRHLRDSASLPPDVKIVCKDGQPVFAHKFVLFFASQFFQVKIPIHILSFKYKAVTDYENYRYLPLQIMKRLFIHLSYLKDNKHRLLSSLGALGKFGSLMKSYLAARTNRDSAETPTRARALGQVR